GLAHAGRENAVGGDFGASGLADFVGEEPGEAGVEIVAAQAGVAIGGKNLEDAFVQFQDREIERAAAKIVHGDFGFFLESVQPVGQRGGGGLVDDAFDGQPSQLAGFFGGVALGVVEVSRNSDDGARNVFAQGGGRVGFKLLEDLGGDFFGRQGSLINRNGDRPGASPV